MKKSRFTEEQIIGVLREQEAGSPTAEVCRRHGIPAEGAGGREPTPEEAAGGIDAGQRGAEGSAVKKLRTPAARREAALRLVAEHGFSRRRACRLIEVDPKTVRRQPTADAPEMRQRLRELTGERRRFGYRRLGILLAREGMTMNHKKLFRLYREEGLAVRRRRGRKRATGTRAPMAIARTSAGTVRKTIRRRRPGSEWRCLTVSEAWLQVGFLP